MKMASGDKYGTLRVKAPTVDFLKDLKEAFEASYGRKFTMDELIKQMVSYIKDGDSGVWDIYRTKQEQKNELKEKIEASHCD